jgi:hypothetical protein
LSGLPGQPDRLVVIAGAMGVEAELVQGQQLPGRVSDFPGQRQRAAAVVGRLGSPAHQPQDPRPAGQDGGQRPARRSARGAAQLWLGRAAQFSRPIWAQRSAISPRSGTLSEYRLLRQAAGHAEVGSGGWSAAVRSVSSIAYRDRPSGPARGGISSEQSTSRSTTAPAAAPPHRPPTPPGCSRIPGAAATAAATCAGSRTAASSASHAPSVNRPATCSAT